MKTTVEEKINYLYEEQKKRTRDCPCSTVAEWAELWLTTYKVNTLRDTSIDKYKRIIKNIKKYFGDFSIVDFDELKAQQVLNSITAPSVKDDCYALLYEMFKKAVKLRYIDFNPIDTIEHKQHTKKHGKALTVEEERAFVSACEKHFRGLAFEVCLYCGLRRGELLALTYEDIDLNNRIVYITKQFQNGNIVAPKTESGIRAIPINDYLFQQLQKVDFTKKGRMFPIKEHALLQHFHNILKDCELYGKGYTLHSLRHTFSTRCSEFGVERHATQKMLGHSTPDMTLNVYTHANDDFIKSESQKINKGVNDIYNQNCENAVSQK